MTNKLRAKGPTTRDISDQALLIGPSEAWDRPGKPGPRTGRPIDAARLKVTGTPAHINAIEDRLLAKLMPESHGKVMREGLLADEGQGGDDRVTLLTPKEQKLLALLGGSGTANPASGLLEYSDGNGTGTSGGGGGDDGNNGAGSVGGGGMGGGGMGGGGMGGPSGSPGGGTSFGDYANDPSMRSGYQESEISPAATDQPDWSQYDFGYLQGYAPPDTLARLVQTAIFGKPAGYEIGRPGRFGAPTGSGIGLAGTLASNIGGPMMSAALGLGGLMDASMSPESRAASMAHNQALGAQNSTGNEYRPSGARSEARVGPRRTDALGSPVAGYRSSELDPRGGLLGNGTAQSAAAGTTSPDGGIASDQASLGRTPTVQPGQVMDTSGRSNNTLTGLPPVVQNLLMDYVWRGRQGTGFNW